MTDDGATLAFAYAGFIVSAINFVLLLHILAMVDKLGKANSTKADHD